VVRIGEELLQLVGEGEDADRISVDEDAAMLVFLTVKTQHDHDMHPLRPDSDSDSRLNSRSMLPPLSSSPGVGEIGKLLNRLVLPSSIISNTMGPTHYVRG
jgi:hypothetical protein